jgi:uncharacterized protein
MRVISANEFSKGLWKNGRGVSWDIATGPSRRGQEFGWRLAIAEITEDGPFSLYGPIDRVFTLIEGNGVALVFRDRRLVIDGIHAPHTFACDVSTECHLTSGPCRALNLFTARGEWAADVKIIPVAEIEDIHPAGATCLLFALQGECVVATAGTVVVMEEGCAALVEECKGPVSIASRNGLVYAAMLSHGA